MNTHTAAIETLFAKAGDYGKTTIELIKLKVVDRSSDMFSSMASKLVISVAVVFFVFCISFGLAYWIGSMLGETYYGFFIVGAFYALIAGLLYLNRNRWIKEPVSNALIARMLDKKKYEKAN